MIDPMEIVLEEARRALEEGDVPIGAAVIVDGVLCGRGHSKVNSERHYLRRAEIIALDVAGRAIREASTDASIVLATSVPPAAMSLILAAHCYVTEIRYAADDPKLRAAAERFLPDLVPGGRFGSRRQPTLVHDSRPEAIALLDRYFRENWLGGWPYA